MNEREIERVFQCRAWRRRILAAIMLALMAFGVVLAFNFGCIATEGRIGKMETRLVGLNKEIQQKVYAHQEAQRDAISKSVQNAGVKDGTLISLGLGMLASVVVGVIVLVKHDERIRQALCRYPGCAPADESVADLPPRGEMV